MKTFKHILNILKTATNARQIHEIKDEIANNLSLLSNYISL